MHLLKWTLPNGPAGKINIELEQYSQESKYAILSHRWGKAEDEVTFQDMLSGSKVAKTKAGYAKLEGCCRQAHLDGHKRVWVDTCCIDKSSSAELSEAITSMYSYYENSQVCYAFLNDIEKHKGVPTPLEGENTSNDFPSISKSAWFERGWTLQELIAPRTVKFFDVSWVFLGQKTEFQISKDIEHKSGIQKDILRYPDLIRAVSVSNRMSWAAKRRTTRIEDRAYSLMGIFGVHMSPIYGEGHNAFVRLQQEIMRTSNDHTLFAWTLPPPKEVPQHHTFEHVSTMLALSPEQFQESFRFIQRPYNNFSNRLDADRARLDYTTTNTGLSINLPIVLIDEKQQLYAAILACTEGESLVPSAIILHTTANTPRGYFWRANTDAGPIERSGKLWFQAEGRDTLRMTAAYILPKLTSVSQDYVEPHWDPLEYQNPEAQVGSGLSTLGHNICSTSTFEIQRTLVHAKDRCFGELQQLSQGRHMIYKQAAQLHKDQFKRSRMFPKDFPWRSENKFDGRSAELRKISVLFERLDGRTKRPNIVAITGIGGVGKTELAREFAYRCREGDVFSSVIWIDSSNTETMYQGFRQVAKDIGLDYKEYDPLSGVAFSVFEWLNNLRKFVSYSTSGSLSGQCLLIFDNVRDFISAQDFWDPVINTDTGSVLVTTRDSACGGVPDSEPVLLHPLNDVEMNLMLESSRRMNKEFRIIASRGNKPLTLAQIPDLAPMNQPPGIFDTYTISDASECLRNSLISQFNELSPSALGLLQVISFFDADSIHRWILSPLSEQFGRIWFPLGESAVEHDLKELMGVSLVTQSVQEDFVQILRLVQHEVQDTLNFSTYHEALSTAISLIHSAWVSRASEIDGREWISENLLPHLLRLETLAERSLEVENDFEADLEGQGRIKRRDGLVGGFSVYFPHQAKIVMMAREKLAWLVLSREKFGLGVVVCNR